MCVFIRTRMTGSGCGLSTGKSINFLKVILLQRPGFMGMNDYAREEKMQKIFDDRENVEEEEDEVKQENKREKDKTVMNNHNDNNNSNHHEEKVSQHLIVFLFSIP